MGDLPEGTVTTQDTAPEVTPDATPAADQVDDQTTLLGDADKIKEDGSKEDVAKDDEPQKKDEANTVPEKYEITAEGMELDEAALELFSPVFKELGITNEGAQKLVDAYVPLLQSTVDKVKAENDKNYKEIVAEWKADALKEFGSESDNKLRLCAKALNKFEGGELKEFCNETGVGNHKTFIAFMARVGAMVSEDTVEDPAGGGSGQSQDEKLKTLYPTMNQ